MRRLVRVLPDVFLGPDAAARLDGRRGFLYGEKRHRQVDVLGFEPAEDAAEPDTTEPNTADPEGAALERLVARRLDRSGGDGWRIVGVAVRPTDVADHGEVLLAGLVAGDVVIAADEPLPGAPRALRILIHRGDRLQPAP